MRLETDGNFHFDFYLAEKLHLTLAQVRSFPQAEWQQWAVYFGRKAQQRELAAGGVR